MTSRSCKMEMTYYHIRMLTRKSRTCYDLLACKNERGEKGKNYALQSGSDSAEAADRSGNFGNSQLVTVTKLCGVMCKI